jgi:uncharacterized membrane protein YgcG
VCDLFTTERTGEAVLLTLWGIYPFFDACFMESVFAGHCECFGFFFRVAADGAFPGFRRLLRKGGGEGGGGGGREGRGRGGGGSVGGFLLRHRKVSSSI